MPLGCPSLLVIDEGLEKALSGTDTVHATDATKKCANGDASLLVCELRARHQVEVRRNLKLVASGTKGPSGSSWKGLIRSGERLGKCGDGRGIVRRSPRGDAAFQRPAPRVNLEGTKFSPTPAALLEMGIDFQRG